MSRVKIVVIVFVLAWVFAFAAIVSPLVLALYLVLGFWPQAGRIFQAQDRILAAMFGWTGKRTVSAECGLQLGGPAKPCRFCRIVCRVLDVFQPGHCINESRTAI